MNSIKHEEINNERFSSLKFLCENYIPGHEADEEILNHLLKLGLKEDPNNPFGLQDLILIEFDKIQTEYSQQLIQ